MLSNLPFPSAAILQAIAILALSVAAFIHVLRREENIGQLIVWVILIWSFPVLGPVISIFFHLRIMQSVFTFFRNRNKRKNG